MWLVKLFFLAAAAIAFSLSASNQAYAHKVIAAAYADGALIEGEVGFSNGEMAAGVTIVVKDAQGNKIGETVTDEEGFFTYEASRQMDHHFFADLSAGHVANFTLSADELPSSLAGGAPAEVSTTAEATAVVSESVESSAPEAVGQAAVLSAASSEELGSLVNRAVAKQVRPLRKELAAYKEERRLQDILGGVGYILGVFGLLFFVMGRRRAAKGA